MLGRVPWWAWALIGWLGGCVLVAVVWVRVMRHRPEAPTPQLDDPLYRGTDLERLGAAIDEDDSALPTLPGVVPFDLPGAILALGYATTEDGARYWLAQCARRGADADLLRELRDLWEQDHGRCVTYLHTDNRTEDDDR